MKNGGKLLEEWKSMQTNQSSYWILQVIAANKTKKISNFKSFFN